MGFGISPPTSTPSANVRAPPALLVRPPVDGGPELPLNAPGERSGAELGRQLVEQGVVHIPAVLTPARAAELRVLLRSTADLIDPCNANDHHRDRPAAQPVHHALGSSCRWRWRQQRRCGARRRR